MPRVKLEDWEREISQRRKELGYTPDIDARGRNTGENRTASKRALLEAIEDTARERGLKPW